MKGQITTYILVFSSIFLLILGGLLGMVLLQLRVINQKTSFQKSFEIAESGIQYYKWCLAHNIDCSGEKDYKDAQGQIIGKFKLTVDKTLQCGEVVRRSILSEGWTLQYPKIKRKIEAVFSRPSVGKFSYILNSNVWIGSDHEIRGPYHSNGGIRMDGENQSLVTSAQNQWICTSSFGCSTCPTSSGCSLQNNKCICPGVFTTANGNKDLFEYPVTPFDFTKITVDLAQLKSKAQNSGIYLGPALGYKGYHLKFREDGYVEVWKITALSKTWAYSQQENWHYDYFTISGEILYNTYSIPSQCSVIFVEDNVWPEGKISGKVTLVSANLINPNVDTQAILNGNIEYPSSSNSSFTLIAEKNILIGPDSPDNMELFGIFIAQKGRFGRNHYPGNIKNSLEIRGTIVSSERVGTQWISYSGQIVSGYKTRETYFDPNLVSNPSPFTPYIEPDFSIVKWQEK